MLTAGDVAGIRTWLKDAACVFNEVATAEVQLAKLRAENGRATLKSKELQAEIDTLENEKAALERMIEAMKDGGKTPRSPLTETEWANLLRETAQSFGGGRGYILKLSDFFGVKSPYRG